MPHLEGAVVEASEEPGELHIEELEGLLDVGSGELVSEAQVVKRPDSSTEVEVQAVGALEEASPEGLLEVEHRVAPYRPEDVACSG